ncbi:hypothetical protein MRX96_050816 [Rhipicephalus microplus]
MFWFCPAHPARLVDFESARLSFRPSVVERPHSPEEEDVLVADVCVSSKPSTGLSRLTTSMPTMQQQRAADSSAIQGAMNKKSALRDKSANEREAMLVDSKDLMDVQSFRGPVFPAKRGPSVIVHQQDPIASKQPPKKAWATPDSASMLSASQSYPTPAPSQYYRVHMRPVSFSDITSVPTKHVQSVIDHALKQKNTNSSQHTDR